MMKSTIAQVLDVIGTILMGAAALYSVYAIGRAIAYWVSL